MTPNVNNDEFFHTTFFIQNHSIKYESTTHNGKTNSLLESVENYFLIQMNSDVQSSNYEKNLLFIQQKIELLTKDYSDKTLNEEVSKIKEITQNKLIEIRKNLLIYLSEKEDKSEFEFEKIEEIIADQPNLLFEKKIYPLIFTSNSGFSSEKKGNLIEIVLLNSKNIATDDFKLINNHLFDQGLGECIFQKIMRKPNANVLFDKIMTFMNKDDLNSNEEWKRFVLNFSFSLIRFNAIFIQDEDFDSSIREKADKAQNDFRSIGKSIDHKKLNKQRQESCNTLTDPSQSKQNAVENWERAQKLASEESEKGITLDLIKRLNSILTNNEEGVDYPGKTRDETNKTVRIAGVWTRLPCPSKYLRKNLTEFEKWLNEEQKKCDAGTKNPILFAAQANYRLVSLHPFENGNGRTSKLLTDAILERYSLPPAILSKNFFAMGFNLEPTEKPTNYLVENIIDGMCKACQLSPDSYTIDCNQ